MEFCTTKKDIFTDLKNRVEKFKEDSVLIVNIKDGMSKSAAINRRFHGHIQHIFKELTKTPYRLTFNEIKSSCKWMAVSIPDDELPDGGEPYPLVSARKYVDGEFLLEKEPASISALNNKQMMTACRGVELFNMYIYEKYNIAIELPERTEFEDMSLALYNSKKMAW